MSRKSLVVCNYCGKEESDSDEVFNNWYELIIPGMNRVEKDNRYDLCSLSHLSKLVKLLKKEDSVVERKSGAILEFQDSKTLLDKEK